MKKSKELEIIKEIQPLANKAENLEIIDSASLKEVTSLLSRLNKLNDAVDEERSKVLKPLLEATKQERLRWKPAEQYYQTAIEAIRSKMTIYQTQAIKAKQEAEHSIVSRIAPGKGNLSLDTAVKRIESLPTIEKVISTDEGSVTFVETKILKVTDLSIIPEEYWHINEKELLADLKKGMTIPGVELDTIQTLRNTR